MSATRSGTMLVLLAGLLAPAVPLAAESLPRNSGYFSVQPDLRLCPAPTCGGVFVSLLNRRLTRCPDGTSLEACHLAAVDWTALGLHLEDTRRFEQAVLAGRGLVRGEFRPGERVPGLGDLGLLVVTEGWIAGTGRRPRGGFYRVSDNGIVCITTPCFTLREGFLNSTRQRSVSGLDFSGTGARGATIEAARQQVRRSSILVAGRNREVPDAGPAGRGVELVVSQFYLRVLPSPQDE